MTIMEAIALLVTALLVPYVVALIRNEAITGNRARWLAVGVSALAGVVARVRWRHPDIACRGCRVRLRRHRRYPGRVYGVPQRGRDEQVAHGVDGGRQ